MAVCAEACNLDPISLMLSSHRSADHRNSDKISIDRSSEAKSMSLDFTVVTVEFLNIFICFLQLDVLEPDGAAQCGIPQSAALFTYAS